MGIARNEHRPITSGVFISVSPPNTNAFRGSGTFTALATRILDDAPVLVTNLHVMSGLDDIRNPE